MINRLTILFLILLMNSAKIASASQTSTPIAHVIIIVQENHSFDNVFGTYPTANETIKDNITTQLEPVNGLPSGVCLPYTNGCVSPYYANTSNTDNPVEGQTVYENDWNHGRMDGFASNSGRQSLAYFDYHQLAAYWNYAEEYGLADNYFAGALTTTTPNRLIMLAGDTSVSNNYGPPPYVPFNETVLNQLSNQGISWGYFDFVAAFGPGNITYPINYFAGTPPDALGRVQNVSVFLQDLQTGQNLPSVSFVNSLGADEFDEHPPFNVTQGELWTVSILNAVMRSSYWNTTAIFLTYDEGGGYFDHVPPPQLLSIDHDFARPLRGYGQRVPLLVISPYSKENYVSHALLNHMSLLRFIDYNWNLPTLNPNVANSTNPIDFFYFNGPPRKPILLEQNSAFNPHSYPIPLQIPLANLPYSRNGTITPIRNQPSSQFDPTDLAVGIVAFYAFAVLWRNHEHKKKR